MTSLVLGVDGGGSKTQLCLVDFAGFIVHECRVGGTNPSDNRHWAETLATLLASIGPFTDRISQAVVAIGGYRENPAFDQLVERVVGALLTGIPTTIDNDVYVAHDAAFLGAPGVLLIAGTGSMAVTRSATEALTRTGGLSELFGDEGSAYWIGREALSLATRALDGRGPATRLVNELPFVVSGKQIDQASEIFRWISTLRHPRSEIAALATTVIAVAEEGDGLTLSLIDAAIAHLAAHVQAGRRSGDFDINGPWSMLGGLSGSPLIRGGLEQCLGPMVAPALPPCGGALWRAASLAGWPVDSGWLAQLRQELDAIIRRQSAPSAQFFNQGS